MMIGALRENICKKNKKNMLPNLTFIFYTLCCVVFLHTMLCCILNRHKMPYVLAAKLA